MSSIENFLPPYINGRFVKIDKPEATFSAINPAVPADILAVMAWNKELVNPVIEGMQRAQPGFATLPLKDRMVLVERVIGFIRNNAEEIKSQMSLELARPRIAVEEEWALCEKLFRIFPSFCQAHLDDKAVDSGWSWQYAPVGLVLVSNTVALPVYSLLSTVLPALAAGNAVAIKPSTHCPLSTSLLASCFHQAQLPEGLVQVVYGNLEVYRRLILTHQFHTILFTGSEETREQIRKDVSTHPQTRLVLCSNGKNAAFVLDEQTMDVDIAKIIHGMCIDTGQRLEATSLVFVKRVFLTRFCDQFVKAIKEMPIALRDATQNTEHFIMGPLCSSGAYERFLRFQGIGYREAGETLRWGKFIDNPGNGFFVSPGVHLMSLDEVRKSVYASSAFFGPDVAIVPIDDPSEAVEFLNSLNEIHALSIFGGNKSEIDHIRKTTRVPLVHVGCPTTEINPALAIPEKGRAEEARGPGLGFLFATVNPKILNLSTGRFQTLFNLLLLIGFIGSLLIFGPQERAWADYQKAVETNEVVKNKMYPKQDKIQVNILQGGTILNQSFISTYFANLGFTYHLSEWHAINAEGFLGFSSDRSERDCVENFYFDTKRAGAFGKDVCDPQNLTDPATKENAEPEPPDWSKDSAETWNDAKTKRGPYHRKPAYMPIRQINQLFNVNYQWTPVYGKALFFLAGVGYMDFFLNFGAGLAMSTYWPRMEASRAGHPILTEGTADKNDYGKPGRPDPLSQTSPLVNFGIGTRFYAMKTLVINTEFRNFTVFGSDPNGDSGWMNFFALWGGVGLIF